MPSRYLADTPKNHLLEDSQDTIDGTASPTSYIYAEHGVQNKIDGNLLNVGDFQQHGEAPIHQDGLASPVLGFQRHFPPPPRSTREAPIPFPGKSSIWTTTCTFCASKWQRNKGPIYVFTAQFFGALMNLIARLLELGEVDEKLHPMQLLFWRMLITSLLCSIYVVWKQIPHGVFGNPEIRWLLITRGFSGFFGIYGVWYSIKYLPLAEATVITFLAPNLAGYWCHIFLKDPYTRTEKLASLLALGGVILITKPTSLFSHAVEGENVAQAAIGTISNTTMIESRDVGTTGAIVDTHTPTTAERLGAIGMSLLGVLGTSFAFTTLRAIGKRAHPLISVNYFSMFCVLITLSTLSLAPYLDIGQPDLRLAFPASPRQWGLLLLTTACGFAVQVLITKGLAAERSNRATAMTYTQMLFAAGFDRLVWGTELGWVSITGCAMIITGAVWVAVGKDGVVKATPAQDDVEARIEGIPMLRLEEHEDEDDDVV
ncbi:hypothetical protein F5Y08DRAFT_340862 [Xylaria arbuscula]|nr:hypothetical protein F5Y08DRAFT_340862 [Xylaria arbuscula]